MDRAFTSPQNLQSKNYQYTGLKDKTRSTEFPNGKEIYEGDILYDSSWWWGACAIKFTCGDIGSCRGDNVMAWCLYNKKNGDVHNIWNGHEVEVIGNIYENPEFLGGK